MASLKDAWWEDVPRLLKRSDEVFAEIAAKGLGDRNAITQKKVIESRGWQVSENLIAKNFPTVLETSKIFYLPKMLAPGPAFVFPLRDLNNEYQRAQIRPGNESPLFQEGQKYRTIGNGGFLGPMWLGSDPATLATIIQKKAVAVVEGPFDWLACKLLVPGAPVMSTLTKSVKARHEDYLRILGVTTLYTLFDYEKNEAGRKGQEMVKKFVTTMRVIPLACPTADPSDALKTAMNASALKLSLEELVRL